MKTNRTETILITGGFGYIGTYLVNLLLKNNYKVIVVDNLCNGKKFLRKNLFHIKKNFSSKIVLDYIQKKKIKKIVHLAAYIDAEESVKNPKKYFKNNVIELKKFLENIKNTNIEKFILASSAAVYGNGSKKKIDENFSVSPVSPYGLTKLEGEKLINYYSQKYFFNAYSLRFFNIAGAKTKIGCGPFNSSYKHIFNILLRSSKFYINGENYNTPDGTCIRDYVNVSDISEIISRILKKKEKNIKVFVLNCGSGIGTSVKSIVNFYKKKINNDLIVHIGKKRVGDPVSIIANNTKIKKLTKVDFKNSKLNKIILEYNEWKNRK